MRFFNRNSVDESSVIDRSIQLAVILILTMIATAQAFFISYALSFILFAVIIFIIVQYRKKQFKHYPYLQFFVFLLGLGIIYTQYKTFLGVEAGTSFLTLCLFAKGFELKKRRDILVIFNFALFVSASLFLHSQSFLMAVAVLLSLMGCFIGLYRVQTSDFLRQEQKTISLKQDIQHILKFLAFATPFFLILFIFFPRFPPFWQIPIPSQKATTGMSDSMSPGDIAELSQSSELAFRILGDMQQLPARQELYWRAMVLDHYDGKKWTRPLHPPEVQPNEFPRDKNQIAYQYLNAQPDQRWIMFLEYSVPASRRYALFADGSVMSKRPVQSIQPIDFLWFKTDKSLAFEEKTRPINTQFVQTKDAQAQALAQQLWQQSQQNQQEYIKLVLNWYKQHNFSYTLTPALLGENRVDDFLFQSRQGFCEHYASSFTMMMRYVGIPARVVIGYQGGQLAPDQQSWEVRQLDAHAWSEVWLNQHWVRIDPTAIIAPNRIDNGMQGYIDTEQSVLGENATGLKYFQFSISQKLQIWSDYASYQWQSKVVGYDVDKQRKSLSQWGLNSIQDYVLTIFILIVMVMGLFYLWYQYQKRKQFTPYQYAIYQLNHKLPQELQQQTGESFQAWIKRLQAESSASCFQDVILIYQRVHYAEQPQPNDVQQFQKLMKACASVLKQQKKT